MYGSPKMKNAGTTSIDAPTILDPAWLDHHLILPLLAGTSTGWPNVFNCFVILIFWSGNYAGLFLREWDSTKN